LSATESAPSSGAKKGTTPHQTLAQAKLGAEHKVQQARRALQELERRHDRAAAKVESLSRRRKALELELGDAEAERDRTASRMSATKSALAAAEKRLLALEQER
jgi:septal ring factor EnvC (AmiA/AmiB activator)